MITVYGSTYIADQLGVSRACFSNWLGRLTTWPVPYATMRETEGRHGRRLMWDEAGLEAWHSWYRQRLAVSGRVDDIARHMRDNQRALAAIMIGGSDSD